MTWWLIVAAVFLVVRRVFRPRITVALVNGVWLATVTSVWSRREYVRTSTEHERRSVFPFFVYACWWREVTSGDLLHVCDAQRADGMTTVHDRMKPVRDYAGEP